MAKKRHLLLCPIYGILFLLNEQEAFSMDGFYSFIFYGLIIVAALLIISITILRIDWARHPEKYAKDVENNEKEEYWKKKRQDQQAAIKKAKEKEKARKRQQRVDKLNHYRAINGKGPVELKDKRGKKKK